jgi:peptidoglycan/LPS O-acetylase OafA/YrhL
MNPSTYRMPVVDALKALASQAIVLHHLATYGAMSDAAYVAAPGLISWLYDYGRMAVAVFLVVAGFLAARGMAPNGAPTVHAPLSMIWRRYLRLTVPYLAAITLAMGCAAVARLCLTEEFVPDAPTATQVLAHAVLLQNILGHTSLSAGVWYIAIDFQLFAVMVLLLWFSRRVTAALPHLGELWVLPVSALAVAGLFYFGRDPAWDNWAVYFFGSYGMGALAWWASSRGRSAAWMLVMACVVVLALVVDFRHRVALALGVALILGVTRRTGVADHWRLNAPTAFLGEISYSVFLVHFPISLLCNALFSWLRLESALAGSVGLLLTWALAVLGGALFHRLVEAPASALRLEEAPLRAWRLVREWTGRPLEGSTINADEP